MWKALRFLFWFLAAGIVAVYFFLGFFQNTLGPDLAKVGFFDQLNVQLAQISPKIADFEKETVAPVLQQLQNGVFAPRSPKISPSLAPSAPSSRQGVADVGSQDQVSQPSSSDILTVSGVFSGTNAERVKQGAGTLSLNDLLNQAAKKKMDDMFAKQYFEHESPSGVGPGELAKSVGYDYILVGENLAQGGFKDDAALVAAWMASPGHRANILNPRFTQIGIAVGQGMYQGDRVWMAVQEFGLPFTACPQADDSLKARIDQEQLSLNAQQSSLNQIKAQIDAPNAPSDPNYNQEVADYNARVQTYNAAVSQIKNDIATYNAQVQAANACRAGS